MSEPTRDDSSENKGSSEPAASFLGFNPCEVPYHIFARQASEIVIGIVGALGTDNDRICKLISSRMEKYGYASHEIRISKTIIPDLAGANRIPVAPKYERAKALIDWGNQIRKQSKNNAILAIASAVQIARSRPDPNGPVARTAYIISSLKNPEEVAELRKIYGRGFYLFAVHTDRDRRLRYLTEEGSGMTKEHAGELLDRDEDEVEKHGQHTRDTFHLADFFLADEKKEDKLRYSIWRCLDLIFGNPRLTPTFDEFAMFMAFAAALRSADLSRQVGAVVTRRKEILSTGANDCPRAGGGLYWPVLRENQVKDLEGGRDYTRGFDSNSREKAKLIDSILENFPPDQKPGVRDVLERSGIRDLTEFGRVVHAEMEALLACARHNVSCLGASLYCTTFPCHNCAKHIIAAGVRKVVYIEPYPKSKALEFHPDSATTKALSKGKVRFRPFVGVAPRQFFDLFSMQLSAGRPLIRKTKDGDAIPWDEGSAIPRVQMLPVAYRDFEESAVIYLKTLIVKEQTNVKSGQ